MRISTYATAATAIVSRSHAQFPLQPLNITTVNSKVNSNVTISFKEASSPFEQNSATNETQKAQVCENTPGVRTYSGFVHLPGSALSDVGGYDINTYFLYFEARNNASTAPLGIYLAGGPGESSTYSAFASESGPCYVNIEGTDTIDNPWSFNNYINMLYIDQPGQTGFSYKELVSATSDLLDGDDTISPIEVDPASPPSVIASLGTVLAAKLPWHFTEHWLSSFPGYATYSNRIEIIGNSWGGYRVPETAVQMAKNLQNLSSDHPLKCEELVIDAVGITKGCVNIQTAMLGYPEFAYNNTHDVRHASEAEYESALNNYTMPGGCRDLIEECRAAGMEAFDFCSQYVIGGFPTMNEHSAFDVALDFPSPCDFYLPVNWYLDNATTQQALGVPLNFTYDSNVVTQNFGLPSACLGMFPLNASSGDVARQNGLPNIEFLLANDVKVAFIFGDWDYRCPWTGGEVTALAAKWTGQSDFSNAGYEMMQGITTPVGQGGLRALIKQHGNFSFSRIIDAGHAVSSYAPEMVYRIWERTIMGLDVVTGGMAVNDSYSTTGPLSSLGWRNIRPAQKPQSCMVQGQFTSTNPWDSVTGDNSSSSIAS